jgi:hypothetical protein
MFIKEEIKDLKSHISESISQAHIPSIPDNKIRLENPRNNKNNNGQYSTGITQELRTEVVIVDTIRSLDDRHLDQQLDVRHRHKLKKRTQGNGVSHKKLVAVHSRVIRHAVPAVSKRNMRKRPGSENTARRIPESRMASVKTEVHPELGTDDPVARKQLQLTNDRTSDRIIRKPTETKAKVHVVGLQGVEDWTFTTQA